MKIIIIKFSAKSRMWES